jgi:hypothetical protein
VWFQLQPVTATHAAITISERAMPAQLLPKLAKPEDICFVGSMVLTSYQTPLVRRIISA